MKSKSEILKYNQATYNKPLFLMAWLHFLNYDELVKYQLLEAFDAAVSSKQIKSKSDWDKSVIEYNEHNLLCGLCILMRKLFNALINDNWVMASIYANDVSAWLYILDDDEFAIDESMEHEKIINYYKNVGKKYKIE